MLFSARKARMDLDKQIAALGDQRKAVALRNHELATRELDARLLRTKTEEQLRVGDKEHVALTKTDAEKQAKAHPDYIAFERETARLTYLRDIALAEAETQRLAILAALSLNEATA